MAITITTGGNSVAVTPIPGTLTKSVSDDIRGGDTHPAAHLGNSTDIEMEVLIDTGSPTFAELVAVESGIGECLTDLTGDETLYDCVCEVGRRDDGGVQIAVVALRGTVAP